jgi:biotin carboxylase
MHVVMVGAKKAAMDALRAAGHEVTVLYEAWEESRARSVRDAARCFCAVDSMASVESLWSALHQIGALVGGVDAVVANSEACVVSAAILGKLLGARALAPEVALHCRDKAVQKAAWHAAGVPTAKFVVIPDAGISPAEVSRRVLDRGLTAPFFVKPTAGYGSRRVKPARDHDELTRVVAETAASDPSMRRLMIEERVEGDEWHFDGVIVDGIVQTFCVSRYLTPVFQAKLGKPVASVSFPPATNAALYDAARALSIKALSALDHGRGVFHVEAFARPGTLDFVAGELAARVGGNAASEIISRTVGIDPWVAAALTITGDDIPALPVHPNRAYGILSLPASAGRTNRVRLDHLSSMAGVVEVLHLLPYGARMPDMLETSSSCIGFALVEGPHFDACQAAIEAVTVRVCEVNGTSALRAG